MIKKLIHTVIIFLVLFQNVWAMDQTYQLFCDNIQNNFSTAQYLDNTQLDNHAIHHEHRCTHGSAPFVGLSPQTNKISREHTIAYYATAVQHVASITTQPPTPPPTTRKTVYS